MRIIISTDGSFVVPYDAIEEVEELKEVDHYDSSLEIRLNPHFAEWVLKNRRDTDLEVVEIPDNATDWIIERQASGYEIVYAVVDGKIRYASTVWE